MRGKRQGSRLLWMWLALTCTILLTLPMVAGAQDPASENTGWPYLGGDAWHTRYSPADQIDGSNFENLEVAWEWDASSFGPSTNRATPSYVGGKLNTVTGNRRHVIARRKARSEIQMATRISSVSSRELELVLDFAISASP